LQFSGVQLHIFKSGEMAFLPLISPKIFNQKFKQLGDTKLKFSEENLGEEDNFQISWRVAALPLCYWAGMPFFSKLYQFPNN